MEGSDCSRRDVRGVCAYDVLDFREGGAAMAFVITLGTPAALAALAVSAAVSPWQACHCGRRAAVALNAAGVPPIEVLAARQRMATLLHENWSAAAGLVGGLAGDQVKTGPSELHGVGVFAARDLEAGELFTLYPVHRMLQTLGDGRGVGVCADTADQEYFAAAAASAEERAYRQVAYRQTFSHPDPRRPETFQLDANAAKRDIAGWVGHRLNDGASLAASADVEGSEALLEYYAASAACRNCCAVALCVPLLGFVTTKPVNAGDELLVTYGHGYWLQRVVAAPSQAVDDAIMAPAEEMVRCQVAAVSPS